MHEKRWTIAISFALVFGMSVGSTAVLLISSIYCFDGGLPMVFEFWENNGAGFSDAWKWVGYVTIFAGAGVSIIVWRWLMLGTGIL